MNKMTYLIIVLFSIKITSGQTLVVQPQDNIREGGELRLLGANSNFNQWNIDNYEGKLRFHHGGSVKFVVNPNGDTGIGTLNPSSRFEVRNSNNNVVRLNFDDTPSISFIPNNGNSHFHISHSLSNRLTISQGSIVGVNHLFTIVNSGNIGIGTITPDSKLTVKGNIHTQEIKVDLNGAVAPDYVFKKGYDLKSLEEVQYYIKEHGHLPNIPSALEMEENGIQLGEMNMKLLEKIEELTLYTLEQEEKLLEMQTLKTRVDQLEKILMDILKLDN